MPKKCISCQLEKSLEEYPKDVSRKSGYKEVCKKCRSLRRKAAYNKEKRSQESKRYYQKNKQKILEYAKDWRGKNKQLVNKLAREYARKRRASDIHFKVKCNLRTRLYFAIRKECKKGSAVRDLGCSIAELKAYLESKFQPGMSWDNYGKWHIDHIRPLASFNLNDKLQFVEACHFTNLQPLWARDNILKRDKI